MEIIFKYGFSIKEMKFGKTNDGLYRLPSLIGRRYYPLKKLSKIKLNGQIGYRCYRKFYSLSRLDEMVVKIKKLCYFNHKYF